MFLTILKLHFEKLPYLLRYVPDNYKTQQMCNNIKNGGTLKSVSDCYKNQEFFFYIYIYNLQFFEQKIYSHQVLIYLDVPGIPVRKPLQNRQIGSWRTTGCVSLVVICASLLSGRHLLMNKKDKDSRYTNIKNYDNLKKNLTDKVK